jgi:uncharacterized membrane protein
MNPTLQAVQTIGNDLRRQYAKEGAMPPLHPAIVHFPIAFVTLSFIADVLGRWLNNLALRATAFWSLFAAALGGIVAAAVG